MDNTLFQILENRVKEKTSITAQHCCVPYCTSDSRYRTEKPIWFHKFPTKKSLQKAWVVRIRRDKGPHFEVGAPIKYCDKCCKAEGLDPKSLNS